MIHTGTSGLWKEKEFKTYNFASKGLLPLGGHLHPLLKVPHCTIVWAVLTLC